MTNGYYIKGMMNNKRSTQPLKAAAKSAWYPQHLTIRQLVRALLRVITSVKGVAPSPKFYFVSSVLSVPRLLPRGQARWSIRRFTATAGPWPTRVKQCPSDNPAQNKTSVTLAVGCNVNWPKGRGRRARQLRKKEK